MLYPRISLFFSGTETETHISADLTSSMGSTPFFSPSMGSENRLHASLISVSSCAVTLCSRASFDSRGLLPVAAGALRFGGCLC